MKLIHVLFTLVLFTFSHGVMHPVNNSAISQVDPELTLSKQEFTKLKNMILQQLKHKDLGDEPVLVGGIPTSVVYNVIGCIILWLAGRADRVETFFGIMLILDLLLRLLFKIKRIIEVG